MLFRETVAVYCENHTKHTDTLWGQNAEFWYIKADDGTYKYHCARMITEQEWVMLPIFAQVTLNVLRAFLVVSEFHLRDGRFRPV
jgi:hypothetical protein